MEKLNIYDYLVILRNGISPFTNEVIQGVYDRKGINFNKFSVWMWDRPGNVFPSGSKLIKNGDKQNYPIACMSMYETKTAANPKFDHFYLYR